MFGNRASNCLQGYSYHVPGQWQGKFKEKLKVKWQQTSHVLRKKGKKKYDWLFKYERLPFCSVAESNKWQLNELQKLSNAKFIQMPTLTNQVKNQGHKWLTVCKLFIDFYSARRFRQQSPTLYVRNLYDWRIA